MMCPKCKRRLRAEAENCLCGWSAVAEKVSRHVDCAYAPSCTSPAIFKRYTQSGPVNLCEYHDTEEHTRRSEAWCLDRGLDSTEKKIQFCREQMKSLMRPRTVADYRRWMDQPKSELAAKYAEEYRGSRVVVEREPGSDFEEDEPRMAA